MAKKKTVLDLILEKTTKEQLNAFGKKHGLTSVFNRAGDIDFFDVSNMTLEQYKQLPTVFSEMMSFSDLLIEKGLKGNEKQLLKIMKKIVASIEIVNKK